MNNLLKRVDQELESCKSFNPVMAVGMSAVRDMIADDTRGVVFFHRLNGLKPTEQSCTFKLLEEVGEVMQIIGKESGASGELVETERNLSVVTRLVMEYMDVAQSSVTAVFTLCKKYDLDIDAVIAEHDRKLREKGYLI